MCVLIYSAQVYGAGKQWAVCSQYSSKHTHTHTDTNTQAAPHIHTHGFYIMPCHHYPNCEKQNPDDSRTCIADVSMKSAFPQWATSCAANRLPVCVRAGLATNYLPDKIDTWRVHYNLKQNEGWRVRPSESEEVGGFVWCCFERGALLGGVAFDPRALVKHYIPARLNPFQ